MGFLDKLLKIMGFQDSDIKEEKEYSTEQNKLEKKESKGLINSRFDLKNMEEEIFEDIIQTIKPKTQEEIELIANILIDRKNVKVDFVDFAEIDKMRALDFLSGVIFVLNGNIEKIDKTIYLLKINKK